MTEPKRPGTRSRVEVRGEWLYVGGEPFLVKGIGYSPYRPGQVPWRDRLDPAVVERDFQRIAAAGFNTIRTWSPLPPEILTLADRYGLMVLQGIWVDQHGDYTLPAFQATMVEVIRREVERAKSHQNVLAFLVGNELQPEQVFLTTVAETETLLRRAAQTVKAADPGRLVSYANWPSLFFLDASMWDFVGFNLYPYEPPSVSGVFGFRSYVEHLKRTVARDKPLIITEVGLSVSPGAPGKSGYGGWTPKAQQAELVRLWEDLFQGGAQGGVIFEWNDEWWKQMESPEDAKTHEPHDPEEWFGLIEFPASDVLEGTARPAYEALKTHNQAILVSPVTEERYQDHLPVTVYAAEGIAQIRVRLDGGRWDAATKLNRHWWKARLPIGSKERAGAHRLTMEGYDARRRRVLRRDRPVVVGPPQPPVRLSLTTDREVYDVGRTVESAHYTVTVTDVTGVPRPNAAVFMTVTEPQSRTDLTRSQSTDASGKVEGTYLIREPGLVTISAATPRDGRSAARRVGEEGFFVVRQQRSPPHQPSPWETNLPAPLREVLRHPQPAFRLADAGQEPLVQYERYGTFLDVGSSTYRYEVADGAGLAAAVGEGIYPNEGGLAKDPAYHAAKQAGKLEGSHWDFTFHEDPQLAFFKWAEADEEEGVKQFYTALTLERAGLLLHAVKAYYAVLVHFPTSIGWTAFDPPTPWYVGKVARDKIEAILRLHPELGLRLEGSLIIVEQGFDNEVSNDTFRIWPGILVSAAPDAVNPPAVDRSSLKTAREVGRGRVRLIQFENGHWQMRVDDRPWQIRGVTYRPTAVGETPDEGTVRDWTTADRNGNGLLDVLETFVDANRNNRQDPEEPAVGDFALLHAMGANTLRLYHTDYNVKALQAVLRGLHERYGLMVMMGDFVGMYTVGSGAAWEEGTNYLDKAQRKRMFNAVKTMVRAFKDEPYLLLWVLGNENNYGGVHGIVGGAGNAGEHPTEYYRFVNELADWIHKEDPNHPVAIGNGEVLFLDIIAQQAPAIDIIGVNAYRGWHGFGRTLFEEVRRVSGKPVLITEFGCPAYQRGQPREVAERDQALYHFGSWVDLTDNMAGRGVGNVVGGVAFEWVDEWWKGGQPPRFSPAVQETQPNWAGAFPGGWNFEEWFGLMSQGDGSLSPFLRQPRVSFQVYQSLWNTTQQP
jgi:beta-glucuronidase